MLYFSFQLVILFAFFIFFLQKVKVHLTQRIENLDGKIDEQRELSKIIHNEVRLEDLPLSISLL